MSDFSGASILITGAASGIGAATATLLAKSGAKKLILIDRDEVRLRDFGFTLPCERQVIVGDVCDQSLWAHADLSGLTHAVVNAGVASASPIVDMPFDEWRRVLSINLDAAFLTLQGAMRAMQGNGGAIVLTSSVSGIKAEPGIAAYAASKAALLHLGRVAAKEGAGQKIRVNAVAPGGVETPIWHGVPGFTESVEAHGEEAAFAAMAGAATPLGRFAKAEEIAAQIVFLLSDEAASVTGAHLVGDGGYSL